MHLSRASGVWRWPAAAALSATAAIHMTLVPEHLREAPYAGALSMALSIVALAAAILLSATDHELVWLAAGAISLGALVAYFLSRSVGSLRCRTTSGTGPTRSVWRRWRARR